MTSLPVAQPGPMRAEAVLRELPRYGVIIAFVLVVGFFALSTPTFLTLGNIHGILVNNFALLAIVSLGMTVAVASGGIDLSVGTSLDLASLAFITIVAGGHGVTPAILSGLLAGLAVGVFNAVLISGLRIAPFLATLGTLFIGRSLQQLLTGGGNPIYVFGAKVPPAMATIGHGNIFGVSVTLIVVAVLAVAIGIAFWTLRFGRIVTAIGTQPSVARYSGLKVRTTIAVVYAISALMAAAAGNLISTTVSSYVPYSGNAFLLNAIGATFIGTTLDPRGRANVGGTLLGVLLLSVVSNGLLLIGWNFYWQQVGTGIVIYVVLVMSFLGRRLRTSL